MSEGVLAGQDVMKETRISGVIRDIIDTLVRRNSDGNASIALMSGTPGEVLFLWNAASYDEDVIDQDTFSLMIRSLVAARGKKTMDYTFGSGLPGHAWLFEYILSQQSDEPHDISFNTRVDQTLARYLALSVWQGELELFKGLAGLLAYATRRRTATDDFALEEAMVAHLANTAHYPEAGQCAWSTPPQSLYRIRGNEVGQKQFNLGLAHGVPSQLASLCGALESGLESDQAYDLVLDGAAWLMDQRLSENHGDSCFPPYAGSRASSRLGWCYGDAAIAITLARAADLTGNSSLLEVARETALAATRRPRRSTEVVDASICHGSAGLALLFSILARRFDDSELRDARELWLEETLDLYRRDSLDGFRFLRRGEPAHETGLLEGIAGIGLALLAVETDSTDWVDCLLLPRSDNTATGFCGSRSET